MKWTALLLLLLAACGPREQDSALYERAVASFRHGDLAEAFDQARAGDRRLRARPADAWRFRLLQAEILIYQGKRKDAGAILAAEPPARPEFTDVAARRKMLLSYVAVRQSRQELVSLLDEARRVSEAEGVALNQFINVAVAEKLSALRTEEYFRERGQRGNVEKAKRLLKRAGRGKSPAPGDELK